MTVPEVIPIKFEPGYRTDKIGRYDGGQFLAGVTSGFQRNLTWPLPGPWQEYKTLFGVLHLFDLDGYRVESKIWAAGTWAEQIRTADSKDSPLDRAGARLTELLDALPGRTFCDIAIRPFEIVAEDVLFGLVVRESDEPESTPGATLWPDDLFFHAPWNGEYDT